MMSGRHLQITLTPVGVPVNLTVQLIAIASIALLTVHLCLPYLPLSPQCPPVFPGVIEMHLLLLRFCLRSMKKSSIGRKTVSWCSLASRESNLFQNWLAYSEHTVNVLP